MWNVLIKWLTLLGIFLFAVSSFAINGKTTYQAKIIKPDGLPLQSASVNFRFTVLDQTGSCVMYVEDYAAINMTDTAGLISFPLGTGVRSFPTSGTAQTFQNTFDNSIASFACQTFGIYNPTPTDSRKIVMQFNDGVGWQTLPAMSINAVPYAMFATRANNSLLLNNKADTSFVEYSTIPTCTASQVLRYNGASFSCGATGFSSGDITTALGYTPANAASYTTQADFAVVSGSVTTLFGAMNAMVTSYSNLATSVTAITPSQWVTSGTDVVYNDGNVSVSGSIRTNNAIYTDMQNPLSTSVPELRFRRSRDVSGAATAVLNNYRLGAVGATGYNGTAFASNHNASIFFKAGENFTTSGTAAYITFETTAVSSTNRTERMRITTSGTVGIGRTAPVTMLDVSGAIRISNEAITCGAGYDGTIRYNAGNLEFCNGTSWSALGVAGAGITSLNSSTSGSQTFATGVTGTVFNISSDNGVHTFNIPLASTGSVTAGLLSNADYVTFSNKISATSAAVATALGYTPANSSTVSTLTANTAASFAAITSSQWTTATSNIYYNSGNVGVGVTNPASGRLTLTKTSSVSYALDISSSDPSVGSVNKAINLNMSAGQVNQSNTGIYLHNINSSQGSATGLDLNLNARDSSFGVKVNSTKIWNSALFGTVAGVHSTVGTDSSLAHSYSGYFTNTASTGAKAYGLYVNSNVGAIDAAPLVVAAQSTEVFRVSVSGNVGVGTAQPSAKLHLAAGTTSMAPLKFNSGVLLSSPQSGTVEYDGTSLYVTDSSNTRRSLLVDTGGNYAVNHLTSPGNITFTPNSSVIVSSTTNSTSSNTGSLVIKGGMGVGGNLNVAGIVSASSVVLGTAFRANQGVPNAADGSTNGYSFGLDGDTGIFSPGSGGANGVVAIYNNDYETMRINPGAVGIGTSSPSAVLQLATTTQNIDRIRLTGQEFYQAGNTDTTNGISLLLGTNRSGNRQLWIADSANMTPNTSNTLIRINPNSRDISALATDGVTSKTLSLNAAGGFVGIGNVAPGAPLTVGDSAGRRGYAQFRDDGANGPVLQLYNQMPGGHIYNIYSGFSASGSFDISDLSSGNASRFTITSTGNIGIGMTAPQRKLHVTGTGSDGLLLDNGTIDSSNLIFHDSSQGVGGVTWNADSANGAFRIYTEPITGLNPLSATAGTERLTILPSGNVGLGTAVPADALHVVGAITAANASSTAKVTITPEFAGSGFLQSYSGPGVFRPLSIEAKRLTINAHGSGTTITGGNVGIGIASPTAQLEVNSKVLVTNSTNGTLANLGALISDSTNGTYLHLRRDAANEWYMQADPSAHNALHFRHGNLSSTPDISILTSGRVGIGVSNPTNKFEVRGGDTFMEGRAYVYSNSGWGAITPSISLAIGDNDTGIHWLQDGELQIFGNNTPRMHFDVDGRTGIQNTNPQYTFDITGDFRVSGQAYTNTGAATFTVLSDERYKDIHGKYERGINELLKIDTIRFNYKKENPMGSDSSREYVGFSAQNLQSAIPEAVEPQNKDGVDFLTVNSSPVIFAMINAIKEIYYKMMGQDREIASLKAKNIELENKLKEFDELKAYICKKDPQAPNCK